MIEVELPDGTIAEFPDGTSQEVMRSALQRRFSAPQQVEQAPERGGFDIPSFPGNQPQEPQQRGIGQRLYDNIIGSDDGVDSFGERAGRTINDMGRAAGAGVARGAAGLADLPQTMLSTGASLGSGTAQRLGLASPEEAQGAQALVSGLGPARTGQNQTARELASDVTGGATEFRGDTTAGQYAGTIGEFIPGTGAVGGGVLSNALKFGVAPGIASEAAGQATEGTAAEPYARTIAPLVASLGMARATQPRAQRAPTADDLKQQADDLYKQGQSRPAAPAGAADQLADRVSRRLQDEGLVTPTGRNIAPPASRQFVDVLEDYRGQPVTPREMQNLRQYLNDAQKSTDAGDRRVASILKAELDDWSGQYVPEFREANQIYSRVKRSEDVDTRIEKADRRAASTGTGGNSVNAARQNIRQILDNPKARRGYSDDEIAAMDAFVRGDRTTNALRLLGRLSPTSGALPLVGFGISSSALGPLGAIPSTLGYLARAGAEGQSVRQVNALSELIRNGGPIPARAPSNALGGATAALLGANAGRER